MQFGPINLWSLPKQLRDYMYRTQDELEEIMVSQPEAFKALQEYKLAVSDHTKAMQGALNKQVGGNHYKDMPIQPIEFIEGNKLSFSAGNVIKYVCRADKKGGIEDLEKAKHYIDLMIERMGK